jgi:transposase
MNLVKGRINGAEAAHQCGLSLRQVKNLKRKVKERGPQGLIHGNRGRASNRRISEKTILKIEEIVRKHYPDFKPTFAREKLKGKHAIVISKEKLRGLMTDWGLWKPRPRRTNKQYRSWRPRKERYGELEQFDGSYHSWFEDRAPECCLLASIDDATGRPTKLQFTDWEGVVPVFTFWKEYLEARGKPVAIYLDRHSTYKQNPKKNVLDNPNALTQFERAMKDLDISIIHAYSPQAKGRVERFFGTLQDRLVKELRLQGISAIPEANRFLEEIYIPKFCEQFSVLPVKRGDLHRPLTGLHRARSDTIFSIHSSRQVLNDFTVRFKNSWFQLQEMQPTLVCRKDRVRIEERLDGSIHMSLREKYLSYEVLPERPRKAVSETVIALAKTPSYWKPPQDHPWRKSFQRSKFKVALPV